MNRIIKVEEDKRLEMAKYYLTLIKPLNLDTYKKSKEITTQLNISGREWRKIVENIMHLYMYNYLDQMVIGTNQGYLLTNDRELIDKFLKAKEHQFKALAYNCYNLRKSLLNKGNYTLEDFLKESL